MSKLREMAEKNSRIAKSRKRDANGRMLPTSLEEKFWSKVDKSSGCWQWTGSKNANGYGYIARTKTEPTLLAHRVSLRVHGTEIPSGLVVDHICRNRACVNPKHLRVVTRLVNTFENSESFVVKNKAKTHCPKGHEYAGENVRHYRSGGGHTSRTCMACCRARAKASKDRKKARALGGDE